MTTPNTKPAAPELLPCPFCGESNAILLGPTCTKRTPYDPADRAFPVVRCGCGAEMPGTNWDQRSTSAVAAWNRRHVDDRLRATNKALLALLDRCQPYVMEQSEESGYGFYRPENPHDFFPDAESCTPEEIANHKAACEAWDRGDYKREPGSESSYDADGKLIMHITRAPWGVGSYVIRDPRASKLINEVSAALQQASQTTLVTSKVQP